MTSIELDDPVVRAFIWHSTILAIKFMALGPWTGLTRIYKRVYANPEDANVIAANGKLKLDDPDVERVRRAHLNDLENIPAFWFLGALYVTTNPSPIWAIFLFRLCTVSRIIHTIVYVVKPLPQPARGLAYFIPYLVMMYMAIHVLLHYI